MPAFSSDGILQRVVRVEQIIVGALAFGLVNFLLIVLLVPGQPQPQPLLSALAVGSTVMAIVARMIVPALVVAGMRRGIAAGTWPPQGGNLPPGVPETNNADRLLSVHQTKTVIEGALLEAAAFFVLVVYLMTRESWLLGIAAVLLAWLVFSMPTRERNEQWVEQQLELLEVERREQV
jgi:hypothetical protein